MEYKSTKIVILKCNQQRNNSDVPRILYPIDLKVSCTYVHANISAHY